MRYLASSDPALAKALGHAEVVIETAAAQYDEPDRAGDWPLSLASNSR